MTENIGAEGKKEPALNEGVKERLMDAAEEMFAEKGFHAVSVRDLTKKAGCNLASVNYYFGGKHELYAEVFRRRMEHLRDVRIEMVAKVIKENPEQLTLEELLTAFAAAFVEPLVNDSQGRRFFKIIGWEMIRPVLDKQEFVEKMIRPIVAQITGALSKIVPTLSQEQLLLCIKSLVGQLLHVIHTQGAFDSGKVDPFLPMDMRQMVEHVVKFTAAGIRSYVVE